MSSFYTVKTKGKTTTITGRRTNRPDRVLVLVGQNPIVQIRNEPVEDVAGNHFIAYYKQIAKNDACCTNLPFRKVEKTDTGCAIPVADKELISTVACSNSNYP